MPRPPCLYPGCESRNTEKHGYCKHCWRKVHPAMRQHLRCFTVNESFVDTDRLHPVFLAAAAAVAFMAGLSVHEPAFHGLADAFDAIIEAVREGGWPYPPAPWHQAVGPSNGRPR